MAACAITLGGTNGTLILNYNLGANAESQTATYGDVIYIDDTATDVTYTRLSGDITATSSCVTITTLPMTCYIISWETNDILRDIAPYFPIFDAAFLGTEELTLSPTGYNVMNTQSVADAVNSLGDNRIKIIAGKTIPSSDRLTLNNYVKLRVKGTEVPYLRVKNIDIDLPRDPHYIYLMGVVAGDCNIPVGYTEYTVCDEPAV